MKYLNILIFMLATLNSSSLFGQGKEIIKIQKFLQEKSDTSFILKTYSTYELEPPTFKIIYKKGDHIYSFLYKNSFNDTTLTIDHFTNKFATNTSINFNEAKRLKSVWKKIISLKPWEIKDDIVDGEACPSEYIYHQSGILFYLITKESIKTLQFYAPRYFSRVCPKRKGREAILKIEQILKPYFEE